MEPNAKREKSLKYLLKLLKNLREKVLTGEYRIRVPIFFKFWVSVEELQARLIYYCIVLNDLQY